MLQVTEVGISTPPSLAVASSPLVPLSACVVIRGRSCACVNERHFAVSLDLSHSSSSETLPSVGNSARLLSNGKLDAQRANSPPRSLNGDRIFTDRGSSNRRQLLSPSSAFSKLSFTDLNPESEGYGLPQQASFWSHIDCQGIAFQGYESRLKSYKEQKNVESHLLYIRLRYQFSLWSRSVL
jgi:hypothetical protein